MKTLFLLPFLETISNFHRHECCLFGGRQENVKLNLKQFRHWISPICFDCRSIYNKISISKYIPKYQYQNTSIKILTHSTLFSGNVKPVSVSEKISNWNLKLL